jgi:hypothetical protein
VLYSQRQVADGIKCFKQAVRHVHGCALSLCGENALGIVAYMWEKHMSRDAITAFALPHVKQWWASLSPDNYMDVVCYTYAFLQSAWCIRFDMCLQATSIYCPRECSMHGAMCPVNPLPDEVAELVFHPLPDYVAGRFGYDWHFGLSRVGTTPSMRPRHHEWSVAAGARGAVNDWLNNTKLMDE